jgi:uncharacterized protein (DUF433 family)
VTSPIDMNNPPDPRDLPRYSVTDAAHYLGISRSTLGRWILAGLVRSQAKPRRLSFRDLVVADARVRRGTSSSLIGRGAGGSASIVIDPRVSFGRPVISGTGIPVAVIAGRFRAGESIAAIAEDYRQPEASIHAAIRASIPAMS